MKSFRAWLLNQMVVENNDDLAIPKMKITAEQNQFLIILMQAYLKEIKIQSNYGGIRNPPSVLQNKIRHELTNYDEIRDAITREVRSGNIDNCSALKIRQEVTEESFELVREIISKLPKFIKIHNIVVSQNELFKSNENYLNKELNYIKADLARCEKDVTKKYAPRPMQAIR